MFVTIPWNINLMGHMGDCMCEQVLEKTQSVVVGGRFVFWKCRWNDYYWELVLDINPCICDVKHGEECLSSSLFSVLLKVIMWTT
jgi:hypothetical protein